MLSVTAFGKINWALDIVGKRADGYHLMDMLMQSVSLGDELSFQAADSIEISGIDQCHTQIGRDMDIRAAPLQFDESNLIFRAAKLLQNEFHIDRGVSIHLIKRIPFGAGMGGGSADAAATLLTLNRLWELNLPLEKLCELGLRLGADIPFMLHGGLAQVQGIGEVVKKLDSREAAPLILMQNCGAVSTKTVFHYYDQLEASVSRPNITECIRAVQTSDWQSLANYSGNVLQPVVAHFSPELEKGIEMLYAVGASFAQMTGSGSVVYGAFSSFEKAKKAADQLQNQENAPAIWLAQTVDHAWN